MKLIYLSGKYVNIDTIRTIAEVSAGAYYILKFIDGDTMNINQAEYEMLVKNYAIKLK